MPEDRVSALKAELKGTEEQWASTLKHWRDESRNWYKRAASLWLLGLSAFLLSLGFLGGMRVTAILAIGAVLAVVTLIAFIQWVDKNLVLRLVGVVLATGCVAFAVLAFTHL